MNEAKNFIDNENNTTEFTIPKVSVFAKALMFFAKALKVDLSQSRPWTRLIVGAFLSVGGIFSFSSASGFLDHLPYSKIPFVELLPVPPKTVFVLLIFGAIGLILAEFLNVNTPKPDAQDSQE